MLVPVPQGRIRKRAAEPHDLVPVLSVVVTPKLAGGNLTEAGMADWPAVVRDAALTVRTRAAGSVTDDPGNPTVTVVSTARSDVWREFTQGLTIAPFSRPRGYRAPAVAGTFDDADAVRATYSTVMSAMGAPESVESELEGWRDAPPPPRQPEGARDEAEQRVGEPDFHQSVARLREHPPMLRLLGLVFDIELDGLPESEAGREISVSWAGAPLAVVSRWTRYDFDGQLFLPSPQGDISRGLVDLSQRDKWRIVTFDVDGGIARLRQAARTLAEDRSRQAEGAPSAVSAPSLPPLRSAGMMLTRLGRAAQLAKRAADGMAAASGSQDDKVLMAEDLVLGYRLDVRPEDGDTWFSLHRRHATYGMGVVKDIVVEEEEEGHVKPHAAVIDDAGLRTDEVVARWDGWSLSVARPRLDGAPRRNRRGGRASLPYEFDVSYQVVTGSLLELEFGRAYQMRARVADLAGGGLERADPEAEGAAAKQTYARHEPIPPPRVLAPDALLVLDENAPGGFKIDASVVGPGGSADRLVIRSEPTAGDFSTASFDADPAYPANDVREAQAPGTTFTLAEHHGFLRLADEAGVNNASRAFFGSRAGEPRVDLAATPELPDPASLGMAVAVLAQTGVLDEVKHADRPWEGTWPQRSPKSIELHPGKRGTRPRVVWVTEQDETSPDGAASRRVRVILPPGCQVDVEVSSSILEDRIDHFALSRFITHTAAGEREAASETGTSMQDAMTQGRHPLLTPPRRLTLTHAVRQPLEQPRGKPVVERPQGGTVARVDPDDDPTWGIHVPSTGAVEVAAKWDEWGDAPEPTESSALVGQLSLPRGSEAVPSFQHDFGDTKHRMVTFRLTALSRFRYCFAESDDAQLFRLAGELEPVSVKSTARPPPPLVVSVVPAFSWTEERSGARVTRTRLGGKLRVELARPWFGTGQDESLAVVVWPGTEVDLVNHPELQNGQLEQVTWTNRDPIHATTAPGAVPGESAFADFASAHDVPLFEGGPTVRALSYPVFSHEGHWYADVSLPGVAAASYSPFVRLAVARFQGESLVGPGVDLRMSTVVTAAIAPVLPDRTLVVSRAGDQLEVTLSGLDRLDTQSNRVFASIERLDASAPADGADLTSLGLGDPGFAAWQRVADGTVAGRLNSPLTLPALAGRHRLVVREVEELGANLSPMGVEAPSELDKRTVYVDVVDLTGL